jgi:tagatose-6-phosphate ketose/aldose isomerase
MKYLGYGVEELTELGGIHTAREIAQQPALWKKIYQQVGDQKKDIEAFYQTTQSARRIILTGAGTSAFIGLSLRGVFQRGRNVITEAISTTDLVTHPQDYLQPDIPTLLVSFARSGNSPESAAVVRIADQVCNTCFHLVITCNADGLLARQATANKKLVFTLPAEANDQSLAMTSSYSGMLLAGKLMADIHRHGEFARDVQRIATYAEKVIDYYAADIRQLAAINFNRAVFLGAGPFYGTATESHLKVQELTDGKVVCKSDSYLGFRHGPKAVVDAHTLVVYIFSNNAYAFQYERDLLQAMKKGNQPLAEVAIAESNINGDKLDYNFFFSEDGQKTSEDFLTICSVVPAQILAFYKSLQLGLKPDAPSVTGAISRVVEGVQIYSLQNEAQL